MSIRFRSPATRYLEPGLTLALLLLGLCGSGYSAADDSTPEQAHLAAALRQLDSLERLLAQHAAQPRHARARFYFDYARLRADLNRMRAGIRDYLSPSRAQPRDPAQLLGDYRQSTAAPSDPEAVP
ncbi:RAQPRD family integrative conjugative element protein [Pseudomonas sp. D(2018)]|uniref:integrative conjugative element protein, RAQPRD family n=1 Tax=Pseudomonas sp. D(2018) TaxID=2502238 RepID=UPI0010F98678|nr:RAQPRD family integrative conjugative element protein [Pseudomonas sp. D(2018)]